MTQAASTPHLPYALAFAVLAASATGIFGQSTARENEPDREIPAELFLDEEGLRGGSPPPRILLVGDSWADFLWQDRTLRDTFIANERADVVETELNTVVSGSTAAQWRTPQMLQRITDALGANPQIEIVQLTIGGNDFLAGEPGGGWYASLSPEAATMVAERIADDVYAVIDHIRTVAPAVTVLLSGYDYPNLESSLLPHCWTIDNDLHNPSPLEVNSAILEMTQLLASRATGEHRLDTVDHLGLMQFTYGFPAQGIAPGTIPLPGDLSLPSPIESMRFLNLDCIHLDAEGHAHVGQRLWDSFYGPFFYAPFFADGFESGDTSGWSGGR